MQMGPRTKIIISGFVLLNLGSVLYMNRPPAVATAVQGVTTSLAPGPGDLLRQAEWSVQRYASLAGLDNQWRMFGQQSRSNWWHVVTATYGHGQPRLLPLPLQSKRSLWETVLFDFKEPKLNHHTVFSGPPAQTAYAHYLARQYPTRDGVPISSITFQIYWQRILPREEASATGFHLDPTVHSQVTQTVTFP